MPIFKILNSNKIWNVYLLVKVILAAIENKSTKLKSLIQRMFIFHSYKVQKQMVIQDPCFFQNRSPSSSISQSSLHPASRAGGAGEARA